MIIHVELCQCPFSNIKRAVFNCTLAMQSLSVLLSTTHILTISFFFFASPRHRPYSHYRNTRATSELIPSYHSTHNLTSASRVNGAKPNGTKKSEPWSLSPLPVSVSTSVTSACQPKLETTPNCPLNTPFLNYNYYSGRLQPRQVRRHLHYPHRQSARHPNPRHYIRNNASHY